ncbi:MAG: helix-turn-helix domain-containing protein [Saprospiraceae bacterium]|jgi:transposase
MARQHSFIELPQSDLEHLLKLQSYGKLSVRKMKRVQVLLSLHDKILPKEIAKVLNLSFVTVYDIKNKYLEEGLSTLDEKPRPCNHFKVIKEHDEALITSIACSEPEEGNSSWTLRLIGQKFVELSNYEKISHETIRSVLKKANLNRG